MQRRIVGFHQDDQADWVAELDCGHRQHVRHRPPFNNRPWVTQRASREERLGESLECPGCDRCELPDVFEPYKRTPDFDETTIPAGLLRDHATKAGVWAMVHVLAGSLTYEQGDDTRTLEAEARLVIPPEVRHSVRPEAGVRFFVEFWAAPGRSGGPHS